MDKLKKLINELTNEQELKERMELELNTIKQRINELEQNLIPSEMTALGINEASFDDGTKITVSTELKTSIVTDRKLEALQYLQNDEQGRHIVKPKLTIDLHSVEEFNEIKEKIEKAIPEKNNSVGLDTNVHPATLNKFGKELAETDKYLPDDLFKQFGLYKVKTKKEK